MVKIKLRIAVVCIFAFSSSQLYAAPDTEGSWTGVLDWPMIPVHAVLTPEGNVFTWGTDSTGVYSNEFNYDLWSPELGTGIGSHQTLPNTVGVDSFCSAALLLPVSGEVMMAGGDARPQGVKNGGITNVIKYSAESGGLSSATDMSNARWYPTTITLPNGEILAIGGLDLAKNPVVTPEIYSPTTNQWRSLFGAQTSNYSYYYPRMWVTPSGSVFSLSESADGLGAVRMYYMNTTGAGDIADTGTTLFNYKGFENSTAVMYRPGKILLLAAEGNTGKTRALTIDVTSSSPIVRNITGPNLETGRMWADTVILPDGKVMLVGGSVSNTLKKASFKPEIWDPATEQWTTMESHSLTRLYHSTSILLQDGRVLVGGGGAPGPQKNTNAEIFSPPLFA